MSDLNDKQVEKTLRAVTEVLESNGVEYRFMGSILPTALKVEPYRKINDLDLLIDRLKLDQVIREFRNLGFTPKNKNSLRVSEQLGLFVFTHPKLLETGFFAIDFGVKNPVFESGSFKFVIKNEAIKKTQYTFKGINFWGIPASIAYLLASYSESNPKREKEFRIYKKNNVKPFVGRPYETYFLGIKVNWLIDFLNYALVLLGKLRIRLGKTYDPWR